MADTLGSPFASIKISKPQNPALDLTNPANRTKEGYLGVAQNFFYYNYQVNSGKYISYLKIQEWISNRLISQGKEDEGLLIEKIIGKRGTDPNGPQETEAEKDLKNFINLDWERLKFWPQLRDQVISRLEETEGDFVCTSINPAAGDQKEDIKWQIWSQVENKAYIQQMEALSKTDLGQKPDTPVTINTKQDLDIFMNTTFKHCFETAMQVATKSAMNGGDIPWRILQKMHYEDIVDIGRFMVDIITNPIDHTTTAKYVDPVNAIVPEFRGHLLDTPDEIAYLETYSVSHLMTMIDEQLTDAQKRQLIQIGKNNFGNTTLPSGIQTIINTDSENGFWQSWNVPVMKMYFSNSDRLKFSEKEGKLGKRFVAASDDAVEGEREYTDVSEKGAAGDKKVEKTTGYDLQYYEQLFWVVGTDIVFDYGKVLNQSRELLKAKKAICPLLTYVVNTASFTDRIRSFDEAANLAWLKMQQAKAAARPRGYTIDVAALANVTVDGKISSRSVVQIFNTTGNLLWSSKTFLTPEQAVGYKPIGELEGGLGRDYEMWLTDLHNNVDAMKQVIGFNDITSGGNAAERTGKAIGELAVEGTQYSLQQIVSGVTYTHCRLCEQMAQKIQLQVRSGEIAVVQNSLGNTITHILGENVVSHTFAFEWQAKPTAAMKAELKDAAKQALINTADPMKGSLNYNDYTYICILIDSDVDLKMVQLILDDMIQKNIDRQTQQEAATAQAQSEGNMKADAQKAQLDAEAKKQAHQYDMELQALKNQGMQQVQQQKDINGAHHLIIKGNQEQQHTLLERALPDPKTTNK